MRHRKTIAKLNRPADHRRALRKNLVASLLRHGQIKTVVSRAKVARALTERLLNDLKELSDFQRIRLLKKELPADETASRRTLGEWLPLFLEKERTGVVRVTRLGFRKSDAAEMALVQIDLVKKNSSTPSTPAK